MDKLLIVSDNHKVASSLADLFVKKYLVEVVGNNFTEVSYSLENDCPNVVIVETKNYADIRETLNQFKENKNSFRIILITSKLCPQENNECKKNNVVNVIIEKPCSKKSIINAIIPKNNSKKTKNSTPKLDYRIIHTIFEAYSSKNVLIYRCHHRIGKYLAKLKPFLGRKIDYTYDLLSFYLLAIGTLDDNLVNDLLTGSHSHKDLIGRVVGQIDKMRSSASTNFSGVDKSAFSEMVYINKRYNGKGLPKDGVEGEKLPFNSRLLRILLDFHYLVEKGKTSGECIFIMCKRAGWYDLEILNCFRKSLGAEAEFYDREVFPLGLQENMVMSQDMYGEVKGKKILVLKKGQKLSIKDVDYIQRHAKDFLDITEPVLIREKVLSCEGKDA